MTRKPTPQTKIVRQSETDDTRSLGTSSNTPQYGQFCTACRKWFRYLTPSDCLCLSCKSRQDSLKR